MIYLQDRDFTLHQGDVREVLAELEDGSVDCVITSPPYWGLRDYNAVGQIGLEPSPAAFVETMVAVFREVRRVLAPHGTCWINLGDSYAAGGGFAPDAPSSQARLRGESVGALHGASAKNYMARANGPKKAPPGLKAKDLCMIPARVALALQADGWYLRSDIIWSKPNPMPESVTDRPTNAHEHVFLLTRQPRYWFDAEAVREPAIRAGDIPGGNNNRAADEFGVKPHSPFNGVVPAGRNVRNVWEIPTQPYAEAHFATYPQELVRRCLLAGCPEWVCRVCGKPRERIVERTQRYDHLTSQPSHEASPYAKQDAGGIRNGIYVDSQTVGWSDCGHDNYRPGVVLDPFLGSGTTAYVARRHARHTIGIELSAEYCALIAERTQQLSLEAELVV